MKKSILYLLSSPFESDTYIYNSVNIEKVKAKPHDIFEQLCLDDLTTLKGRLDAIKKKYGMRKNIPIYLKPDLVFFRIPIDNHELYLNAWMILNLRAENNDTVIHFKNGTKLLINKNIRFLKRQWQRSLSIIKSNENVY